MNKQIRLLILVLCMALVSPGIYAQVVISDNPAATADPAAMLDLQSTGKGFLVPRMTLLQRNLITNPPTSLVIYQTDNTPGLYYNTGTPAVPNWQKITDANFIGGYWTQNGTDLYYTTGNVGVGENSPSHQLHVNGASMFENDSIYITGDAGNPGRIFLNAATGDSPVVRWGYEGTTVLYHDFNFATSPPYWSMSSDLSENFWMIHPNGGRLWHDYQGGTSAHVIKTAAPSRALSIENTSATGEARGIQVSMSNASNPSNIIAVGGWAHGDGTGVYGMNTNGSDGNFGHVGSTNHGMYGEHYPSENRGVLGSADYGVYGRSGETDYHWGAIGVDGTSNDWGLYAAQGTGTSPNFGGIGTATYGVYGEYGSEDFFGVLGHASSAVYGQLGQGTQNLANGDFAIKGLGVLNALESGGGYSVGSTIGGVAGINNEGVAYSFGVAGYTESTPANRAGGVLGAIGNASQWGALGYRDNNGNYYGGYFTNATGSGSGKAQGEPSSSIGIGVYGDLFGAHVHGDVYGIYAEGRDYSLYAKGDVYRTGADIHLQPGKTGQNSVMYTLVSPEMTVQTYGIGQLQNGKAIINFDEAFADVVSSQEPIVVTITPIGQTKGVYLEAVEASGFRVAENDNGKSSVQFSWIAIGKRSGFENKSLPQDVIASDYDQKIERGLVNDADLNASGEGLYYQNGRLYNGQLLQSRSSDGIKIEPAKKLEPILMDDARKATYKLSRMKDEKENIDQ